MSNIYSSYGEALDFSRRWHLRQRPFTRRHRLLCLRLRRIANLDINTLAQSHTYFVSKLLGNMPGGVMIGDRLKGGSPKPLALPNMFCQIPKFKKGDWLLASYDATGLKALPTPIHTEAANQKIL
jgi:hypothetical protein